jgi:DNA-directed RNA polymerase subunit H (RpoH/RPB5)
MKPEALRNMLKRYGLSAVNKPKSTPSHPKKSHIVAAKEGDKIRIIRFGEQGADTVTESNPTGAREKKRASFKARHAKNIAKGKMSAAYWADKVKW